FSLSWALGSPWLLSTVGQWAVELSEEGSVAARIGMLGVAAVKLAGATVPVAVAYGHLPWRRFWRALSWVGGLVLTGYGAANTLAAAAVLTGVVCPGAGYDRESMIGLALLWSPLFMIWGAALVVSLWRSRGAHGPAHWGDARQWT